MPNTVADIKIPDSKMARDLTQLIRDTESDLLVHHSARVYMFGALTGQRKGLTYNPELLYVGAMFHDIGLDSSVPRFAAPLRGRWRECSSRLPARLWHSGSLGRDCLGRDRAAYHTRHSGAQEAGGRARHLGRRDGCSWNRLSSSSRPEQRKPLSRLIRAAPTLRTEYHRHLLRGHEASAG